MCAYNESDSVVRRFAVAERQVYDYDKKHDRFRQM